MGICCSRTFLRMFRRKAPDDENEQPWGSSSQGDVTKENWIKLDRSKFLGPQDSRKPEAEEEHEGEVGKGVDTMAEGTRRPRTLGFLESLSRKSLIIILQAVMAEVEDCCFEYINRYPDIPTFHKSYAILGGMALEELSSYIGSNTNYLPGDSFAISKTEVSKIMGPYGKIESFRHGMVHRYEKRLGIGHIRSAFKIPYILKDENRFAFFGEVLAVIKESVALGCIDVPEHPVVIKLVSRRQRLSTTLDFVRELGRRLEGACFEYAVRQNFDTSKGGQDPEAYDLGFWWSRWEFPEPDTRPSFNPQNEMFPDSDGARFEGMMERVRQIRNMAAHGTAHNELAVTWNSDPVSRIPRDPTIAAAIRFALVLDCPSEAVEMELSLQRFGRQITREAALESLHSELFACQGMMEVKPVDLLSRWENISVLRSDLIKAHNHSLQPLRPVKEDHRNSEGNRHTPSTAFSSSDAVALPQLADRPSPPSLRSQWIILDVVLTGCEDQSNPRPT